MPRIRDLGVSHIPATMRPPEIGPGGAFDMPAAPDAAFPMHLTNPCPNSCVGSTGCGDPSVCNEQGGTCEDPTCPDASQQDGDRHHHLGGLTPEVIIQLKQHLRDRIGTQFQM
jgi:hypothetical protein